jgi:hypothetical protein
MILFVEDSILNYFVRWGDLDSYKRQVINIFNSKDSDNWRTWHIAPDKRGFYAFPLKFIEPFLLSSTDQTQGKPAQQLKYRKFKLNDDKLIWSHFTSVIPRNESEAIRGDWVLSAVKIWKQHLGKAIAKSTNNYHFFTDLQGDRIPYVPAMKFGHPLRSFDDFEVFIPAGSLK